MADLTKAAAHRGESTKHVTRYAPDKSELQIMGESVHQGFGGCRAGQE